MPNLVGLGFSTARARLKDMNLPLYAIVPQPAQSPATINADGTTTPAHAPAMPTTPAGPIASQSPTAGARVTAADNPHVTMTRGYYAAPAPSTADTSTSPAPTPPVPIVRTPPTAKPQ